MEKKEKTVGLTRTGMTGGKIMCIGCGSGRVFWQQLRLEDSSRLTVFCFKFKGFLLFLLLSLSLSLSSLLSLFNQVRLVLPLLPPGLLPDVDFTRRR